MIGATLCANSYEGLDPQNNWRDPMRQFLWGYQTPKIIGATLCANSYGGLDPKNEWRDPMHQFLWESRPRK